VLPSAAGYACEEILLLGPRFLTFVEFQVTPGGSGRYAVVCFASRSDVREMDAFELRLIEERRTDRNPSGPAWTLVGLRQSAVC
jgi:hypothetical protein